MSISRGLRLRLVISLIILSIVFTFTLPSPGYCEDWVYVGRTDHFEVYYNNTNIKINREYKLIKVWVKMVYTKEGRKYYIGFMKKRGVDITGYNKLDYTLCYCWFYYTDMKCRVLSFVNYSTSGEVIERGFVGTHWEDIIPECITDDILKKILNNNKIQK
jgi:hypothetical protein